MLRLDPLLLAGPQAEDTGLVSSPAAGIWTGGAPVGDDGRRRHLRDGRPHGPENEVAIAIRRRLAAPAPARLTGERPDILSIFVEEINRLEWRGLRERLEGEARQFMTNPEARPVVAVSFISRLELFGVAEPDAAPSGDCVSAIPAIPQQTLQP